MSALTHSFRILRYSTAILYILLTKIMTNAFLFVLLKGENQGQHVKSLLGHIQNYQIVQNNRIYAQHGGVALYVKESIKLDRLHDYEDTNNNHIEVIWCKLRPYRLPRGFSGLIVGVLYHPPNSNGDQMKEYLLDTLSEIERSHPNCGILLAGDFNRLDV